MKRFIDDIQFKTPEKVPFAGPMVDIMEGCDRWEVPVLDKGFVALVDVMPRFVPIGRGADFAIAQAARVSTGSGVKTPGEDRGLVRHLFRERHTSPYEMVEFKFDCAMPIFVARQWIRHRTANVNELSGRYSILPNNCYTPKADEVRSQGKGLDKQVADGKAAPVTGEQFAAYIEKLCEEVHHDYKFFIDKGVGKEMARIGLPVATYTRWYWKIDLHNLLHFLGLRMDVHAQKEIRDYANAMYGLIKGIVPDACEAFMDYHPAMDGMAMSRMEIAFLNGYNVTALAGLGKAELTSLIQKLERINMPHASEVVSEVLFKNYGR